MNKKVAKKIVAQMSENEKGHYEGVLAALSVVHHCQEDVLYSEIVRNCGPRELVAVSIISDDHEFSGLDQHGYSKRKQGYESRFIKS